MAGSVGGTAFAADGPPRGGAAAGLSWRGLVELITEDWRTHGRSFTSPGFHAVVVQRIGAWRGGVRPGPLRKLVTLIYEISNVSMRNIYGIELSHRTSLGRRVRITHHAGVVLDDRAVIGDDVLIRQNVTIALGDSTTSLAAPEIGAGVRIGAGAVIVGGVTVGDGAIIGPNSVVVNDVPPGATVFAPPARQMKATMPKRAR